MLYENLNEKNPAYTSQVKSWQQCDSLYHGGDKFTSMITTFLPQNPSEPPDVYETRKCEASYSSYLGPIVDFYVSWLFSGSFTVSPKKQTDGTKVDVHDFYSEFQNDIGGDISLRTFLNERMTTALVQGAAHWLVVMPPKNGDVDNKLDWEKLGLGKATLQAVEREAIYDWDEDSTGKLEWCLIHSSELIRKGLGSKRNIVRETWKHYDKQNVTTYSTEYPTNKKPGPKFDVPVVDQRPHGCIEVPLVTLAMTDGMWIGNRIRSPQIEHFRLTCANSWLIKRCCYAMPVLNLEDTSSVPVLGAGYYVAIGVTEKFSWTSPPNTPFDVIAKETAAKRDEIFRIVHQMAQGLDNNAETTGRSAESKGMDVAATRIMLIAYGALARSAIEETFEIISDARGDIQTSWSVEGFNGFDTTTAAELIITAANAQLLQIPSNTFSREIKTKVALAMMPELDQHKRDAIRQEISDATSEHVDLDELNMDHETRAKIDIQKLKNESAIQVAKEKSKTSLKIQESKDANVKLEVTMAKGGKVAGTVADKPSPDAKPAISQKALNLMNEDT